MGTYVVIEEQSYRTDTEAQIEAAQAAMRACGVDTAAIYATPVEDGEGDPEHPDAYATGSELRAE
jgi:hypothetical protein